MNLTVWAIRNIKPIVFVTVVLCLAGGFIYSSFPVSILPDVTFPRVVVIAEAGDRPTKMVEVSITRPIEEAVAMIPNVKRIRSKTQRGSTEISVDFVDGTDVIQAEQMVNTRVNEVRTVLPAETMTEVERMNPTVFPILGLTLNSKSLTQTELWSLANYKLKPRLARVQGVARVVVQGGRAPEVEVGVRPESLAESGLSMNDIVQAIADSNTVRSVGRLEHEFQQFQVTVTGETASVQDLEDLVVGKKENQPIRLRQIADVKMAVEDHTTVVSANGVESVLLNVIRQPSANSVAMVDAVRTELKNIKRDLPNDVRVGTFYDQSVLIKDAVGSVRDAVLIGSILSVIILMLFLRDLRATAVTAAIIPMTLLITFLLMRLAGMTLNLMTLGALAVGVGLVIDDAIVVVECVFSNLAHSASLSDAVKAASSQIAAPMVSSTLTTVVVFLPLAFLQGVSGAFFSALAITLSMALMVSLGLALCVSPSLCAAFLSKRGKVHTAGRMVLGYERLLKSVLHRRWLVAPTIVGVVLGTWFMASKLETGFMPAMDEGSFVLDYWTPTGTSLDESDRILKQIDKVLLATPEVQTFSRRTGTELGFAITEPNRGDYAVMLKEKRSRDIEEIISNVRSEIVEKVPGVEVEFIQVLQDLIGDLAGNPEPIEIKLFGESKGDVESVAEALAGRLESTKGIVDVNSGIIAAGPEVQFVIDPGQAGRLGMTASSIATQAEAALLGTVATQYLREDRQIPVRVRFPLGRRKDLEQIERTPILTPAGRVPLRELGKVILVPGTTQSAREDQRRLVAVTARLEGVDLGTGIAGVRKAIADTKMPPGVNAVIAGQFQSQQESFTNLTVVLGTAVLLVFIVMLFQFRSFVPPTVILILMPLSLFGAVTALSLTHTALNVSSFMGVIMLAGIVVKNGILLLDRAHRSIESGAHPTDAIIEAARVRMRPILMTTLTAVLGLVPLAFGLGTGAEMQKPLAVAVVGGLVFSTVLTLIIGPAVFSLFLGNRSRTSAPTEL